VFVDAITSYRGAVNYQREGRKYKKHIIVRRYTRTKNTIFQLYTYHFPTHWSAACVENRELIKEAQRQAHALEHDHSLESLEWRIRYFRHYFNVFKGGAKPEPGFKPYSRFYQYTFVAIYRQLQSARDIALQTESLSASPSSFASQSNRSASTPASPSSFASQSNCSALPTEDEVSFAPIIQRPSFRRPLLRRSLSNRRSFSPLGSGIDGCPLGAEPGAPSLFPSVAPLFALASGDFLLYPSKIGG
jgi:hypothetical protein